MNFNTDDEEDIEINSDSNKSDSEDNNGKKNGKNKKEKKREDINKTYNEVIGWMDEFREENKKLETEKINNQELLLWVEKFRPDTLSEVVSHEKIIKKFKIFIKSNYMPHILLNGPPGTGKTSTAIACAKEIYGDNYSSMVLEINASEKRGIEVMRNEIKKFICSKTVYSKNKKTLFKLVILDEADAMTTDAQTMLVSFVERYSINVRFFLICNYIKKISQAIQSRCIIFKFSPLNKKDIIIKINKLINLNILKITNDGIDTIIKISKGDMRKVLNILQVTNMAHKEVNSKNITTCIGYPTSKDIDTMYYNLTKQSFNDCLDNLKKIINKNGYSLNDVISELTDIIISKFMNNEIDKNKVLILLPGLSDIEINLTLSPDENIQLTGVVGYFQKAFFIKS